MLCIKMQLENLRFRENQTHLNTTNTKEFYIITASWSDEQKAVAIAFLSTIDTVALTGNLLVILVVLLSKSLREATDCILIVNLAITDFLVGLTLVPFSVHVLLYDEWHLGGTTRVLTGFGNFFFCIASIVNLMVLLLDRLLFI